MAFDFSIFDDGRLDEQFVDWLVNEQAMDLVLHYERLWGYYRNELSEVGPSDANSESARPYRQAQEYGLPSRITGMNYGFYGGIMTGLKADGVKRKEVVVENDIAWRIDTMVDFLFGKGVIITSKAPDPQRAKEIQRILQGVFDANGGSTYFQELALMGSVYGFVDVILRLPTVEASKGGESRAIQGSAGAEVKPITDVLETARQTTLEAIEAPRSLAVLAEDNSRQIEYFIQHYWHQHNELSDDNAPVKAVSQRGWRVRRQRETHNVEILGAEGWQRYQDSDLVMQGPNPLGFVPVVHIQNMPQPHSYEGQGDVAPLIPLQDELNTRLSDRANRITFQSFKMYLGKGIEGFEDRVVAPGRMWSTENPEACIEEFGGDTGSPSEEAHISCIRDAMDKASGVASVAAGLLKGRIGNLTSAVALKVTLMGVLAKTERKRRSYGQGIADICRMVLAAFDKTGVYPNRPEERQINVNWPSPLPENMTEKLQEAVLKKELGVPPEQVLRELGYSEAITG